MEKIFELIKRSGVKITYKKIKRKFSNFQHIEFKTNEYTVEVYHYYKHRKYTMEVQPIGGDYNTIKTFEIIGFDNTVQALKAYL